MMYRIQKQPVEYHMRPIVEYHMKSHGPLTLDVKPAYPGPWVYLISDFLNFPNLYLFSVRSAAVENVTFRWKTGDMKQMALTQDHTWPCQLTSQAGF